MAARTLTLEQLRGEMRSRKLTQFDVARRVGVSQAYISQIMSGDINPRPEIKARFEAALADLGLSKPMQIPADNGLVFEVPVTEPES